MNAEDLFNSQILTDAKTCIVDMYGTKWEKDYLLKFAEVYASMKQDELIEKIVKKTYEIVVDEKYYTEPLDNAEMIKDWLKSLKS